jgi:hypothetical protein
MNPDPISADSPLATPVRPRRTTHYLWIAAAPIFALLGPAAFILFWTFAANNSLGDFGLLFLWVVLSIVALGIAIWSGIVRRWGRAVAASMLPLSLALAILNLTAFWSFVMGAGEYIHFRLERESYLAEIAALPSDKGPRTVVFVLSEDGWAGINNNHLVVYDETDEVALPEQQRSASWKEKVADTALSYGVGYLRPLGDHFYIVRISY